MNEGLIAARYARAYFNVVRDRGEVEAARDALNAFARATTGTSEMVRYWANATVEMKDKRDVLEKVLQTLGADKDLSSFLLLLLDSNRYHLLPFVAKRFEALTREHLDERTAVVTSARPLSEGEMDALRNILEKKTGKKIIMSNEQDPALLGGIVVRMGGVLLDGSVKSQLERLYTRMAVS
jgi:F-type H+-transporting ATPase subunit delta